MKQVKIYMFLIITYTYRYIKEYCPRKEKWEKKNTPKLNQLLEQAYPPGHLVPESAS